MDHLLICQLNPRLLKMKSEIIRKFNKLLRKLDLSAHKIVEISEILSEHLLDATSLKLLAMGLPPFDLHELINKPKLSAEIDSSIQKVCRFIRKRVKEDIWKTRITIALDREKSLGISRKLKRKKPARSISVNNDTMDKITYKEILPPSLQQHITDWIRWGAKFAGY